MNGRKFTFADKEKITNDWNMIFPSLGVYKPMHLLNRLGPLLIGILLEVKPGNGSYTPIFHVHNLCKHFPVVTLGLEMAINRQYINQEKHESKYQETALQINKEALIPFEEDIPLDMVLKGYETYIDKRLDPFLPQTYEDMILVSAWCGNKVQVQTGLKFAQSHMKNWPEEILARIGGLDVWLMSVEEKAQNREKLIMTYEEEIINLRADKLPIRNILY